MPTQPSFAAWKTMAWADRGASRDLFDLWSMARAGMIDGAAARLFAQHGPTNRAPAPFLFSSAPDESLWRRELAGQTNLNCTAAEALAVVRNAWRTAVEQLD